MANYKHNPEKPGNANLPIGGLNDAKIGGEKNAILENGAPRWHSRGYLPHFESSDVIQHVTFHLADSLPQTALLQLESELKFLSPEMRTAEHRKQVDAWIDAGQGSSILRKPAIAQMVQTSLLTFDSQRYRLLAWVVMPNHVHVLFQPLNGWTVAKIVASWKKFTARSSLHPYFITSLLPPSVASPPAAWWTDWRMREIIPLRRKEHGGAYH